MRLEFNSKLKDVITKIPETPRSRKRSSVNKIID